MENMAHKFCSFPLSRAISVPYFTGNLLQEENMAYCVCQFFIVFAQARFMTDQKKSVVTCEKITKIDIFVKN